MILTVTVPDTATFAAYYYGGADEVLMYAVPEALGGGCRYVLAYSDDYRAQCQEARFASGLYFCKLLEGSDG